MRNLSSFLSAVSHSVAKWLAENFKAESELSAQLYDSMRYSLEAGGKRLRPALLLCGYNLFKESAVDASHPAIAHAAAIEMIHTYSLIHDDLPAMDNDDMRRGKPTNHIVFGEAVAILAGDGLLTKAFEIFLDNSLHPAIPLDNSAKAALEVAKGVGPDGMVAGQYADMIAQGNNEDHPEKSKLSCKITKEELVNYIITNKTAIFIAKSLSAGAILAGANDEEVKKLHQYGICIGLAFQVTDDILDLTSTTDELGKPAGSDEELDKLTYTSIFGLEASMKKARSLADSALEYIKDFSGVSASHLKELVHYIVERRN